MSYLYKDGEKRFVHPIDRPWFLENGWSLTPPVATGELIDRAAVELSKIEINTAKVEDLLSLKIAPTKAKKILEGIPYPTMEEAIALHPELAKVADRIYLVPADVPT